jgi:hypothetical protein
MCELHSSCCLVLLSELARGVTRVGYLGSFPCRVRNGVASSPQRLLSDEYLKASVERRVSQGVTSPASKLLNLFKSMCVVCP